MMFHSPIVCTCAGRYNRTIKTFTYALFKNTDRFGRRGTYDHSIMSILFLSVHSYILDHLHMSSHCHISVTNRLGGLTAVSEPCATCMYVCVFEVIADSLS